MNSGLITIIESIGIIAFAVTGAIVAIKKGFDIFGIIVLGVITAVGGGAIRDIILGIEPPFMFQNPIYVLIAFITSCISFIAVRTLRLRFKKSRNFFSEVINFFDAIGLGIFAVTGTNTAIINGFEDKQFLCIFVGVITGIGGGMLRDILARKIPFVLYKDIYAVAAIVGASLFYYMHKSGLNEMACIFLPITVTIIIRVLAPIYSLHLPKITNFEIKDDD